MPEHKIWAAKVGPVVVGGISERKPQTSGAKLFGWFGAAVLIGFAVSPVLGFVMIILTAIFLAAITAAHADDERTHP